MNKKGLEIEPDKNWVVKTTGRRDSLGKRKRKPETPNHTIKEKFLDYIFVKKWTTKLADKKHLNLWTSLTTDTPKTVTII